MIARPTNASDSAAGLAASSRRRLPACCAAIPSGRQRAAFTLIEVLIAMSVCAIVLVAVNTVFYSAIHLRNTTSDALERSLPVEQALASIQHDLANLVYATNGTFFGPLQTTNPTNALPGQVGPDFFTSTAQLDGMVPWGNVQKIDYALVAPTNRIGYGQDLVRAITHNLLPVTQPELPEEKQVLLSGVQSLTFLYYDGTQWQTAWDTTQQTNLPVGIKVQIRMAGQNNRFAAQNQPLELVVPMDIMVTTNTTTGLP
jgi:type II secretion system protein J